jgi:murein DD-endopeptidase MepM/ murein hydrolase activator NlpD
MAPRVELRIALVMALSVVAPPALAVPGPPIVIGLESEDERQSEAIDTDGKRAIPKLDGVAVDERYPILGATWVHPVTGTTEIVPTRWQRKYGAPRFPGGGRRCGRGHCGVDLDGPRGRPIVAVLPGTILNVERRRNGKDGRSGRYIKIQHEGGVITAYMHLDSIAPGISAGDEVDAGDVIGALGKSGIRSGDPHLHFGLEIKIGKSWKAVRHVDPTPFLERARVVPEPSKNRSGKRTQS